MKTLIIVAFLLMSVNNVFAFNVGDVTAHNILTGFYNVPELSEASRGINKYKLDYLLKVRVKGVPVWAKLFHSRDEGGDKDLHYFTRYTAGYTINKNVSLVVENQDFNFKDDELYRVGVEVKF